MYLRTTKLAVLAAILALAFVGLFGYVTTAQASPPVQGPTPGGGDPAHGAYVFKVAEGCGCHTTEAGFLAGGEKFAGPFGVVYSRNITQDKDTGIGNWTDQQIITAIRTGHDDQGKMLFPIMPYHIFSGMSDADVKDLVAFLRTVPPIKNQVPEDQLKGRVPPFNPPAAPATSANLTGVQRGQYLVTHESLCISCHQVATNPDGSPVLSKFLAGGYNPLVGGGSYVANITPDNATGIGTWSQEQIVILLKTGQRPDGSYVGGLMKEVIDHGFNDLTYEDAFAIAAYLKSIPAVNNAVPRVGSPPPGAPGAPQPGGALPVIGATPASPAGGGPNIFSPPAGATPAPGGGAPTTLPTTGVDEPSLLWPFATALALVLIFAGLVAYRLTRRIH